MIPSSPPPRAPRPDPGSDEGSEGAALRAELLQVMDRARTEGGGALDEVGFRSLALRVLRFQARANPVYGALLRGRGLDAEALEGWEDFPPVPVRAFRDAPPYLGGEGEVAGPGNAGRRDAGPGDAGPGDPNPGDTEPQAREEARFLTSGTTAGAEARGIHRVRDLSLYHASLLPWAERHLAHGAPRGENGSPRLRVLALLPPPAARPESSLVHMAGVLLDRWDDGGGGFLAGPDWELQVDAVEAAFARAVEEDAPVLLLATAFALVHWMEGREGEGRPPLRLPPGSRIMETGGFKGRSRELPRAPFLEWVSRSTGVPPHAIVNEYGMTEMLSQFYEPVLGEGGPADPGARRLVAPPWVRTRILDPVTLAPVPQGEPGLLMHLDLANLYSAAPLLTEDLGVAVPSPRPGASPGIRVLGRNPGSPPRGCSLTMEAWLSARQGAAAR